MGVLNAQAVAAPYSDKMVMLLLCGFLLALAVEKWGLHRRVALMVLVRVGRTPSGLLAGVMAITAVMSMWISNTATTLMMLPIVLALVSSCRVENSDDGANVRFAQSMLLALAYSASIGGLATPVGTPPNLLFQGIYSEHFPSAPEIGFGDWMLLGVPVALSMLFITWLLLTKYLLPVPADYKMGDRGVLKGKLALLGNMSVAEKRVALGFAITCFLWVFRKQLGLPSTVHDSTIAAAMAIIFFLYPSGDKERPQLLEWRDAKALPWGLLLLFGGGIALSKAFEASELTTYLGALLVSLGGLPTLVMVIGIALAVTFLTEITSNTATTSLILPVLAAASISAGLDPLLLMIPATLAASCAFMLPVATAPNAIVVGSGQVDQETMVRTGIYLNLIGVVPIAIIVMAMLT
jgi:sodium-dependent dicarboxylate transporter 2/3/5